MDNIKQRLEEVHAFQFRCHPGVSCFTSCCQDINIVLTPYDVLRMKNGLGISSEEFLDKYTIIVPKEGKLLPVVILKMNDDDKRCPFVTKETGCRIYSDRPWPCRMYPLTMNDDGTYSLITDASRCKGLEEKDTNKVIDWLHTQEVEEYDELNEFLSSLTIQMQSQKLAIDNPQIQQMIFMSLYNIDKFRKFVFESTFLERLDVEEDILEKIKNSDTDLLKFAFEWIKFGLFGKKVFWVKEKPQKK
ncbi:MAG: YkgJ family cysteine cluster protein [Candidatus Atribacteria bacterium]|nr:YkgJ family cysteine cluster protein [Candidatus Atribacteria bacterium]